MKQLTEDLDQIGPFYKARFDALSDSPGIGLKNDLFANMDLLEGKRAKTIYLHFNLFGMKIAASITMLIVSSLALVAVAAVTILAVRNNSKSKPEMQLAPSKNESAPAKDNSIQKNNKKDLRRPTQIITGPLNEEGIEEKPIVNVEADPEDKNELSPKNVKGLGPLVPLIKNGDNSKVLKEIDDEEDLFGK